MKNICNMSGLVYIGVRYEAVDRQRITAKNVGHISAAAREFSVTFVWGGGGGGEGDKELHPVINPTNPVRLTDFTYASWKRI